MGEKKFITPRLIIHGGAGSITRTNLPPDSASYRAYVSSLSAIVKETFPLLTSHNTALDVAVHAVKLLEDNPLFNAGKGAVFTTEGKNELEASVMVSGGPGAEKRGVGVAMLKRVKNPIALAAQLLVASEGSDGRGGRHNFMSGSEAEMLAERWGVELVDEDYFWSEKRWQEHLKDLERNPDGRTQYDVDELEEYLPMGTVGAVALDVFGNICVATSTGGLTNKLPGRIGDTPTLGAGFWAEQWDEKQDRPEMSQSQARLGTGFGGPVKSISVGDTKRAVGISGTGNGDFFLKLQACHSIASRMKFAGASLQHASEVMVGSGGEMEKAGPTGKGQGGIIGIEHSGTGESSIVWDLNCGGMFRAYMDDDGQVKVAVFADEEPFAVQEE
ncbi:N-terminal nucleophile aminohydrolase [Ascobolus immersus RN42]|uniref:N-terminal nucleophile aminohydrolase n=1 Tax=Ascobolus immersus RN42 TaxID=1160509 RepID=A0A3N4HJC2_ASCIM|nr:N-terminal nucleophile aminohydrolase [Ascobolus immersus RN42]